MLLTEAVDLFIRSRVAEGRSRETIKIYRACMRSFLHSVGNIQLADVTADTIRGYLANARQRDRKQEANPYRPTVYEPLSPESIRTYYRHIRVFFGWCFDEGLIQHDPTHRVRMPPSLNHAPKDLSDEDFWRIVKAAGMGGRMPERDRALVLLLGDTGVRAGGVVGLTLDRVNLERCEIEVIEKGERSRLIPILPVTVGALRAWLEVRPCKTGVSQVFTSQRGTVLTVSGLHQAVDRIARRAGVVGRSNLHAFRHFFGRRWVQSGGDISTLADVLGHSQIHITKMYYLRYDMETIRREHQEHSPLADVAR